MAKKAAPWFWEARNGWYVLIDGTRHFLGEHPAGAGKPQKSKKTGRWNSPEAIDQAFRKLLEGDSPQAAADDDTVVVVLDDFVAWCRENRAKLTAGRYEEFCQDFVNAADGGRKFGSFRVGQLSAKHVTAWLGQRPTWGPTTKRNAITALQRGFNWAVRNRGLARNPIAGMEKPEAKRRTKVVAPADFEALLPHVSASFHDLIVVSYDSGARPFEVKELEARHCQLDKRRAVIPADEAKGRRHTRAFYFPTERSLQIVRQLCDAYPQGPLFRNARGRKWTANAVKCTFARLEEKTGSRVTYRATRHWTARRVRGRS
jgi:site-specific recombinase XerC